MPPVRLSPLEKLARDLAEEIRKTPEPTRTSLALKYRPTLIQLGLLRQDSKESSCLRRLQQFLASHVYVVLIPEDQLSQRTRSGRSTGALRDG